MGNILESDGANATGDDLGHLVFQRSCSKSAAVAMLVIMLAMETVIGFTALFQEGKPGEMPALIALLTFFGGLALCCACPLIRNLRWTFHEHGMVEKASWGSRVIRYRDVEEMSFATARFFINGLYHHTVVQMLLKPRNGGRPFKFAQVYEESHRTPEMVESQRQIEDVREFLAAAIADRMSHLLDRGQAVAWTNRMRILRDGLQVVGQTGQPECVGWRQIARVELNNGVFRLWLAGRSVAVVEVPVGSPNFFAGYSLAYSRAGEQLPLLELHAGTVARVDCGR